MISAGKPIVRLRDVRKIYVMGHHGGGGLFGGNRNGRSLIRTLMR